MNHRIIIDSNICVAYFDDLDVHSDRVNEIWEIIENENLDTIVFDCVVNETISVICRRFNEKGRKKDIKPVVDKMGYFFYPTKIVWTHYYFENYFHVILDIIKEHDGALSFHDALIALIAKEEGIGHILSFDKHFDLFPWIKRISAPEQLIEMLQHQ